MCLSLVSLDMQWEEDLQTYVGYGYKNVPKTLHGHNGLVLSENDWNEASGWESSPIYPITRNRYPAYNLGFHIFLNIKDAINYDTFSLDYNISNIYLVAFTDVIGFGKNDFSDKDYTVISRYMYFCKPIPKEEWSEV